MKNNRKLDEVGREFLDMEMKTQEKKTLESLK